VEYERKRKTGTPNVGGKLIVKLDINKLFAIIFICMKVHSWLLLTR
jgi:hypothetical protein